MSCLDETKTQMARHYQGHQDFLPRGKPATKVVKKTAAKKPIAKKAAKKHAAKKAANNPAAKMAALRKK